MDTATIIGALASVASVASFTPQVVKVVKTRDLKAISAPAYAVTVTSFALWTSYGVLLGKWPLIATNAICLVLAAFILAMKLLPQGKRDAVADAVDPAK
ncbi:MAG: SemiSWEET family transporter [Alphaproteobacteria bacterium]|nr:SemiSWEET family transporter [Alphaproteobacteria bacterium]